MHIFFKMLYFYSKRCNTNAYFINGSFLPINIPDEEFNKLYDQAKSNPFPLFKGQFEPSKTPTLREIVEESKLAYTERLAHLATSHGY